MSNNITRVLILEDSPGLAEEIIERLTLPTVKVVAVATTEDQVNIYTQRYSPDLVIVDLNPEGELDAFDISKSLEREYCVPILYVAAEDSVDEFSYPNLLNRHNCIWKPLTDKSLELVVEIAVQKRRLEDEYQRSEKWYSMALNSISDGIIATNEQGVIKYLNQSACALTGYYQPEAINKNLNEIFVIQGEYKTGRRLLVRRDGSKMPIEWEKSTVDGIDDATTGTVNIFRDISNVLERENKIKEYQEELEKKVSDRTSELERMVKLEEIALEVSADLINLDEKNFFERLQEGLGKIGTALQIDSSCVYEIDPSDKSVYCPISFWSGLEERNDVVANNVMKHGDFEYWIGTMKTDGIYIVGDISELPDHAEAERALMEKLGINGVVVVSVGPSDPMKWCVSFTTVDSQEWQDSDIVLFKMIANVFENVLERREGEKEQRNLQDQLNQSQKMEAIGKLTGGIAHDFNNMLVPILGYTDSIIRENNAPSEELMEIRKAAKSAAALTRQLLAYSRRQILVRKQFSISELVLDLESFLKRILGEDIIFRTQFDTDYDLVRADRSQLEQVFLNLCVNARDAMPGGGTLRISTKEKRAKGGSPTIVIEVSDTGCGIEDSVLQEIFDPFFTTKGFEGTGLGLSVVLGVVEQHDGWVKVDSKVGKGTKFTIGLPAVGRSERRSEELPVVDEASPHNGSGRRILLIEDEPAVSRFVRMILEKNGYLITSALDKQEAIEIFDEKDGEFDLIFTDAKLPDGTGIEVLDHIFAKNHRIPALISSGYTDDRALLDQARKKGVEFLPKPYSLDKLHTIVEKVLSRNGNHQVKDPIELEQLVLPS